MISGHYIFGEVNFGEDLKEKGISVHGMSTKLVIAGDTLTGCCWSVCVLESTSFYLPCGIFGI